MQISVIVVSTYNTVTQIMSTASNKIIKDAKKKWSDVWGKKMKDMIQRKFGTNLTNLWPHGK